jgi:hypothetical protein
MVPGVTMGATMPKPETVWRGTFGPGQARAASGPDRDWRDRARAAFRAIGVSAYWGRMPAWLRQALVKFGVALVTIAIFAAAIASGFFVAITLGNGRPWVAIVTTVGVLLIVVLPLRLWWVLWQARQ